MKYFRISLFVTLVGLLTSFLWGGYHALILTLMLATLEISLSFDNAIVNSSILQKMSTLWQARFLTWGIFIAVFGMRLVLPIAIVAAATHLPITEVVILALQKPDEYAKHITYAQTAISAFGGMFLLMVFLSFIFNQHRNIHWLGIMEKRLNQMGALKSIEILIALLILLTTSSLIPTLQKVSFLTAGIIGMIMYGFLNGVSEFLNPRLATPIIKNTGIMSFVYLECLDASFSLDAVLGAFAITKDVVIILLGLMIGAVFVRSLTVFLTHHNLLSKYRFLEHGAHYAIGVLSIIMLFSLVIHIPEIIIGFIGVSFIGLALISSIQHNLAQTKH